MSKEIKTIVLVVAIVVLGSYFLNLKKNQAVTVNAPVSSKAIADYLSINDNEPILNDKFEYYALPDSEKDSAASPELKKYLIDEYYLKDYSGQFGGPDCIKPKMCFLNDEINASQVDLNEDGIKEYIVMPWNVCGCRIRGASGNGDIFVVKDKGGKFEAIGQLEGNGYTISKHKTNGYFDLLTNFHSSAVSGTETLYKFQIVTNGDTSGPSYQPFFDKWYDFSRTEKENK